MIVQRKKVGEVTTLIPSAVLLVNKCVSLFFLKSWSFYFHIHASRTHKNCLQLSPDSISKIADANVLAIQESLKDVK